jgi:S1-C subfamily serine protease
MATLIKDLSASLREAIRTAAAFTVILEREPYSVSGVLIEPDKVLTASHLVEDAGAKVTLANGASREATLAGRDPSHDLALLRLKPPADAAADARPAVGAVEVGDLVLTLRRDPFDGVNASLGMVSAAGSKLRIGRMAPMDRYLQLDAPRLAGSTGGPLADGSGKLVGIQVFNRRMGAEVAVPAALAIERAALLAARGTIKRAHLGIRSQTVELPGGGTAGTQDSGLLVVSVEPGSPADRAGLLIGDVVVGFGAAEVRRHEDLLDAMSAAPAGAASELSVLRAGKRQTVRVTLGEA